VIPNPSVTCSAGRAGLVSRANSVPSAAAGRLQTLRRCRPRVAGGRV
jgi:hypothetical protein